MDETKLISNNSLIPADGNEETKEEDQEVVEVKNGLSTEVIDATYSEVLGSINANQSEVVDTPYLEEPEVIDTVENYEQYDNDPIFDIDSQLKLDFEGKIVKKGLTNHMKEGANVPTYVLEYLLGRYCSSDDELEVQEGINKIKDILSRNYVRSDESQVILSKLKETGKYTIIDKVSVKLDIKKDQYLAEFLNLGIKDIVIGNDFVTKYDRLLAGGIWSMITLGYEHVENNSSKNTRLPVIIRNMQPIQISNFDLDDLKAKRGNYSKEAWMDILLRSIGMEPDSLTYRQKWLHLLRLVPLVENNVNQVELGPRSTGKSHVYKEISPYSILVSGGQTTVANLFYNLARRTVGLVGLWDCVTFDEVAGIDFKDTDGIQIMKDYMASGSFSRGKDVIEGKAGMVFVGNINDDIQYLISHSTLFDPFPKELGEDTAFLDRIHCYLPGWEIPKYKPTHFTSDYGFITDYISEFMKEMRKTSYSDAFDYYFELGNCFNQRDTIAVRKLVSGLCKLVYPDGTYTKDEIQEILVLAIEMRRRVKEQLKVLGGQEFLEVELSYVDKDTGEEVEVMVPEYVTSQEME